MMVPQHLQVFLAVGATDMRKSINGLCLLVQMHLALEPFGQDNLIETVRGSGYRLAVPR